MTRVVTSCWLFLASVAAASAQGVPVQRICPIDGKSFTYQAAGSPPSRELHLDMKPADATSPWPHPKCPGNGFVLYKSNLSAAEVANLRDFVLSDKYRSLSEVHSTRYLEAVLRRQLGESPYNIAWALVQATWEVSSDPVRYKQYADEALSTYDSIPLNSLSDIRHRILKQMISGELARRLGQFESAKDRFLGIRDNAELSKPFYQRIVELQLKLIRAKDAGSHRTPN